MSSPILRFVATSDWHFGRRVPDVETLQQLIDSMAAVRPSFVLALGDFVDWHRPDDLKLIFARLAQIECPVGVLFGNHDILIPEVAVKPSTTWEALETFCGLASDAGLHPLDREPLIVGGAYVCGTGAWYDYTLGDSEWPQEQYAEKRHEEELIRNLAIDRWGMPDAEVCTVFMSDDRSEMRSFNTSYYPHRPFIICEPDDSDFGWAVRPPTDAERDDIRRR